MKKTFLLLTAMVVTLSAAALPARRDPRTITQADGSTITVYAHGDEHFHWFTNAQGEWIAEGENGMWHPVEALSDQAIQQRRLQSRKASRLQRRAVGERNIAPRGLIILVNYKDLSFKTAKAELDSMLTGYHYTRNYSYTYEGEHFTYSSEGSARQYFYDVSDGQYNPQFDVIGPVTVSQNMSYYGKNVGDEDSAPEVMIKEACQLAHDNYSVDFSLYDNDNDGYVDFVYVIYAGYGEADGGSSNTIWPHSWNLTEGNINLRLNGKTVDLYACGSELSFISKLHDGIGTFCHEFSHVLGLPDLYETTNSGTWKTMGAWDILDYGPYNNDGNTPPAYSGYERFYMGWRTPRVLNSYEQVTLNDLNQDGEILLVTSTGKHNLNGLNPNPATFYVIENRQQSGWDTYLPGHGMLLTKIQYSAAKWEENTVNNTKNAMGVDLIEADGKAPTYNENNYENGYFGKAKDAFPAGATSYTKISGYPIRSIAEKNKVVTFQFMDSDSGSGDDNPSEQSGCDEYDYTFEQKIDYDNAVELDAYTWSVSASDESYIGYMNDKGVQFGSSKKPATEVHLLTSDASDCVVNTITVNASIASKGNGKLSVQIGGTALGAAQSLTINATDYTFHNTADLKGDVDIILTNTQKAMYIKTINITYKSVSTAIEPVTAHPDTAVKTLRNGQIIIRVNGHEYNATGQRLN